MGHWGKIAGVGIGWAIGGPIGGLIGGVLGAVLDEAVGDAGIQGCCPHCNKTINVPRPGVWRCEHCRKNFAVRKCPYCYAHLALDGYGVAGCSACRKQFAYCACNACGKDTIVKDMTDGRCEHCGATIDPYATPLPSPKELLVISLTEK